MGGGVEGWREREGVERWRNGGMEGWRRGGEVEECRDGGVEENLFKALAASDLQPGCWS